MNNNIEKEPVNNNKKDYHLYTELPADFARALRQADMQAASNFFPDAKIVFISTKGKTIVVPPKQDKE